MIKCWCETSVKQSRSHVVQPDVESGEQVLRSTATHRPVQLQLRAFNAVWAEKVVKTIIWRLLQKFKSSLCSFHSLHGVDMLFGSYTNCQTLSFFLTNRIKPGSI